MTNTIKFTEGIYNIYKPVGITTYRIVNYVKKNLSEKLKVGHGGTLDPFAEGVVVVAVGRKYTKKLCSLLTNTEKEYIAEILLDKISDTYDITGKVLPVEVKKIPTVEEVNKVLELFTGEIEQIPPVYSAVKIQGERLCDKIRKGKISYEEAKMYLKPKKIKIYKIELLNYNFPKLVVKILCSAGTYIRTLAKDIGEKLCCGGVVAKLVRTKVGNYDIDHSLKFNL
ncbi:MAG: tRNA pseudouridine(55) synthase TruB [Endomicrobia bacterium]|nr:tRNA pseudouridine(55) synthase TruB [Endomicrobiia bacterium]MCX7716175.1 tRNA pseudouridine(55) synthase TruB [Endomicrobiia bacterium]